MGCIDKLSMKVNFRHSMDEVHILSTDVAGYSWMVAHDSVAAAGDDVWHMFDTDHSVGGAGVNMLASHFLLHSTETCLHWTKRRKKQQILDFCQPMFIVVLNFFCLKLVEVRWSSEQKLVYVWNLIESSSMKLGKFLIQPVISVSCFVTSYTAMLMSSSEESLIS